MKLCRTYVSRNWSFDEEHGSNCKVLPSTNSTLVGLTWLSKTSPNNYAYDRTNHRSMLFLLSQKTIFASGEAPSNQLLLYFQTNASHTNGGADDRVAARLAGRPCGWRNLQRGRPPERCGAAGRTFWRGPGGPWGFLVHSQSFPAWCLAVPGWSLGGLGPPGRFWGAFLESSGSPLPSPGVFLKAFVCSCGQVHLLFV